MTVFKNTAFELFVVIEKQTKTCPGGQVLKLWLRGMDFHRHRWCLLGNRSDFAALRFPKSTCCRSRGTLCAGCAQICIYSKFTIVRSYIQILNHRPSG